jgi:CRP/FNR family cyclic AMP-dependent transcriptional regulator
MITPDSRLSSDLTPADLQVIGGYGVNKFFPKNSILINEGSLSDGLYIIWSGKVKVYMSDEEGREVILNILGANEMFGELTMIDEAPRSASIITLENCNMGVVSRTAFIDCMAEHPEIAWKLIRALVRRVRTLSNMVKNLALLDVYGRVARTLEGLTTVVDGKRVIEQRLTHQDIANMVGASREMVSRIMKELVAGDYIRIDNRRIVLMRKLPSNW